MVSQCWGGENQRRSPPWTSASVRRSWGESTNLADPQGPNDQDQYGSYQCSGGVGDNIAPRRNPLGQEDALG